MYIRGLFLLVIVSFLITGCYTKFVTNQRVSNENVTAVIDSTTGDTVKVINRIDTVVQKEREVCVWERDLMGYPRLRCYKTFYPRDWYVYNNTPWWYNDPFWGDYDRCPRNYYYDPDCGCCKYGSPSRYYGRNNDYYRRYPDRHWSGGSNSSGGGSSGSSSVSEKPVPQSSRSSGKKVQESELPKTQTQGSVAPTSDDKNLDKKTTAVEEPDNAVPVPDTIQNVKKRDMRSLRSR